MGIESSKSLAHIYTTATSSKKHIMHSNGTVIRVGLIGAHPILARIAGKESIIDVGSDGSRVSINGSENTIKICTSNADVRVFGVKNRIQWDGAWGHPDKKGVETEYLVNDVEEMAKRSQSNLSVFLNANSDLTDEVDELEEPCVPISISSTGDNTWGWQSFRMTAKSDSFPQ